MSEVDMDLLYECLEDVGAKLTPGTGKIFVDGKEASVSEVLDLGLGMDVKGKTLMGTGNDILGSGMLYCAVEGSDEYKPLGVVSTVDLSKVSTENDISEEWCNRIIVPDELTINFKLKTKHHKKTFKKWLMAHGYTRDVADTICGIVGKFQGRVTYEAVYLYIFIGGHVV